MTRAAPPILKLDDILSLSKSDHRDIESCHTYGIFKDKLVAKDEHWHLTDDTCGDIKIKLCGPLDQYPIPIPGDIVRIHRLTFDRINNCPIIPCGRNVVIWRGFRENPTPITKARSPSYSEFDTKRRKELEIYHESFITPINLITKQIQGLCTVAGQIDDISSDRFGNSLFKFCDGTGTFLLRVFPKKNDVEDNIHYEIASRFIVGDLMIATSVCLDRSTASMVNLSANSKNGRSISKIEPNSYLGRKLTLAIEASTDNDCRIRTDSDSSPVRPLRRSPRLNAQINTSQTSTSSNNSVQLLPTYTKAKDIPMSTQFKFYDLAGQVRGQPNETTKFNNYVLQLHDGSKPEYSCYYADEVKDREPYCVTILVFSKQAPQDTNQHIESVKKLKSGDLVFVKNVKATWKEDRLKLEMSANLAHGKSITVIDRATKFGEMLDDIVSNPITQEEIFHDAALDTSKDSNITSEHVTDD